MVKELVYGSETGKYAGGSLATIRVIHVPKVFERRAEVREIAR
jgi:hypothetical protein